METTPSLACANKCVFCWRHHSNPVGTEWKWAMDQPDLILDGALENHYKMIKQMKGVPGVLPERYEEGFNVKHFDDIIMEACDISDAEVEPQPLWEYPCQARSQPKPLITFNFNEKVPEKIIQTTQKFDNLKMNKRGSGVVFWMDWYLTDQDVICTGPTHPIEPNVNISWNMHHKQGVHFFVEQSEEIQIENVSVDLIFEPTEGDISFAFQAE